MTFDVRPVTGSDDGPGFAAVLDLFHLDQQARDPGDPPLPERQLQAELFEPKADGRRFVWIASEAGRPVGLAWAETESAPDDDLQVCSVEILVPAQHRRRGVAHALTRHLVPELVEAGQTSLAAYPCHDLSFDAARTLCQRLGMTRRSEERCSRARRVDIDDDLLGSWIDDAAQSAPGYYLAQWQGVCPERWAEAWVVANEAMDDMPLDDFEFNRHQLDVDGQRTRDEAKVKGGFLLYRTLAVGPDGAPAGLTELMVHEDRPQVAYQEDTAVLRAHRGKRLGRWLKAANHRFMVAAHPEVDVVETYNAESNPWMLDINVAMGFRPHHNYDLYQGSVADILRHLPQGDG